MAFRDVLFPTDIGRGFTGGPQFSTTIVRNPGGYEQRNQQWQKHLGRWKASLNNWSDTHTKELFAFFNAVAVGQAYGFLWYDWGAGENIGTDEPIGTGTGSSADYQTIKRYTYGAYTFDKPVYKPAAGSYTVKVAGVPTGSFSINNATGMLTINATNGAAITASYTFYKPVRFASDDLDIQRNGVDENIWSGLTVMETRDYQ